MSAIAVYKSLTPTGSADRVVDSEEMITKMLNKTTDSQKRKCLFSNQVCLRSVPKKPPHCLMSEDTYGLQTLEYCISSDSRA